MFKGRYLDHFGTADGLPKRGKMLVLTSSIHQTLCLSWETLGPNLLEFPFSQLHSSPPRLWTQNLTKLTVCFFHTLLLLTCKAVVFQ